MTPMVECKMEAIKEFEKLLIREYTISGCACGASLFLKGKRYAVKMDVRPIANF